MSLGNEKLSVSDRDWPIFERHFTKWLSDNSRNLSREEAKHFKNASIISLSTGVSSGYISNSIFKQMNVIPNVVSRRLLSVFIGLYTSVFTINRLRKNIYLKLLESIGPAGNASRKILQSTKELNINNDIDPIYLPNPNTTNSPNSLNTVNSVNSINTVNSVNSVNNVNSVNSENGLGGTGEYVFGDVLGNKLVESENVKESKYKTWDDIRSQSQ
ncbi:hypothetical protein TpMuguga_02g00873 [Theileria parva strain Muguga]|uniref:Uncharacterized protein n=1 Tax=Theileria parva TaxID=5875 RepID=Q4N3W5_THEPA|nr:uncharacterized protein TpMuguga_02g00873 [Theileria parva strain Muguga]EAN33158.1 hypothetical protein TpMuguga_02g00873 [Theileria parva strain Muguga]|eukprot:XP_765441.1 hypothetical protein [Theileria parva strain Muguga]